MELSKLGAEIQSTSTLSSKCRRIDDKNILWVPVKTVNPHITCGICQGYLFDACTITECMHSFCKSCIVKHLEKSLNCPMCAVLIHPTDPYVHIRFDGLLQDIVYALLPDVEKRELEREKLFYEKQGKELPEKLISSQFNSLKSLKENSLVDAAKETHHTTKQIVENYHYGQIVSPVSVCLQCFEPGILSKELSKQYIRVTGAATIRTLSSFLKKKLLIDTEHKVDMYCPCRSGFVYLNNSHTLKAVKDLYYHDKDLLQLRYDITQP